MTRAKAVDSAAGAAAGAYGALQIDAKRYRAELGIAALQGHIPKFRDATQAYMQARIDGPDRPRTLVRLPRQW